MRRAISVSELLNMKKEVLPFSGPMFEAFGQPERVGVWFIWGNSGNGKSSFVMQLCKELCKFGTVAYDSLEEGSSLTMQNTLRRFGMTDVNRRFILLDAEPIEELKSRMNKRRSADFYVIDSFQYTQMSYREYIRLKEAHPGKLIIFISHADGKSPDGRSAKKVMYDASLKVWVEGFRAISKGRYFGDKGYYTVWREGEERYWGNNNNDNNESDYEQE